ncbi:MAG: 2-C-methyl-D-erythritol 2,4-cyclodiphosphate synthase [Oscillospiraceae bacterium]|nr:2-C-methyl-D-erythritol 2,4-cyclodiphosphate synthase [Oscillospiraceae bacterium]
MYRDKKVSAIIVAAGASRRMGFDKLFYKLEGKEVLLHSIQAFVQNNYIDEIVVVAGENFSQVSALVKDIPKLTKVVQGGKERSDSVKNGLEALQNSDIVAIHDGARPFVSQTVITQTVEAAVLYGAAAPAVPVKDTIKEAQNNLVMATPPRKNLFGVQTPQVFVTQLYKECLQQLGDEAVTDDCMVVERAGKLVTLTQGDYGNIKITTAEDLPSCAKKERKMRIGHGYDVHKLTENRKLILGGVEIPYEKGLLGHSDADVLTHAVMDALLGAAALGDIGKHFPDSDIAYKGANSIELLKYVGNLLAQHGYKPDNIDATLVCQKPKLAPHILQMRKNIAAALQIDESAVNVKATTEEGMGFTGTGKGIAAHAVALIGSC